MRVNFVFNGKELFDYIDTGVCGDILNKNIGSLEYDGNVIFYRKTLKETIKAIKNNAEYTGLICTWMTVKDEDYKIRNYLCVLYENYIFKFERFKDLKVPNIYNAFVYHWFWKLKGIYDATNSKTLKKSRLLFAGRLLELDDETIDKMISESIDLIN